MTELVEGGYHWQSAEHVSNWFATIAEREPERARAFSALLGLLDFPPDRELRFLDLGAGAGAVSALILERWPGASGLLVDFSEAMKARGAGELRAFEGRYRYLDYDMNDERWPADLAGPFAAVVSSQAIHHLPNARKAALFRQALAALEPAGVFANWDPHRQADAHIDQDDHHSKTLSTLDEELGFLRQAGFEGVRCVLATEESALVAGSRMRPQSKRP